MTTRKDFEAEIVAAEQRCESNDPAKAMSLMFVAMSIADRWALHEFGRLTTIGELTGLLNMTFAQLRGSTGNASTPKGGVQA